MELYYYKQENLCGEKDIKIEVVNVKDNQMFAFAVWQNFVQKKNCPSN